MTDQYTIFCFFIGGCDDDAPDADDGPGVNDGSGSDNGSSPRCYVSISYNILRPLSKRTGLFVVK